MSQVKTKVVAFRVSEQDFNTLAELANRLFQMGQVKSQNPNLLAKEYIVWSCWVVSVQPCIFITIFANANVFALARGMADTMGTNPCEQQQSG
jgi:hypothetical protein